MELNPMHAYVQVSPSCTKSRCSQMCSAVPGVVGLCVDAVTPSAAVFHAALLGVGLPTVDSSCGLRQFMANNSFHLHRQEAGILMCPAHSLIIHDIL